MKASSSGNDSVSPGAAQFATTHWRVVLAAGRSDSSHARDALAHLCQIYWYPLYAYVRRQGHSPEDAQDLTQEFFARFLEKSYLDDVDRAKGKFRSFLLASLKHFLANEWDRAKALKRGGGRAFISLDDQSGETRYGLEPADSLSADKIFERRWALTLLEQVLAHLRTEYMARGKTRLFDELKICLTGEKSSIPYAELGSKVGMTEGAVKVAVHRLRQRYRELLRAEIGKTVASPEEVDQELRYLFAALS
jgi:RNA polymerase sigma factor (sigma-70 family)